MLFSFQLYVYIYMVIHVHGFRAYTALQNVVFTNNYDDEPDDVHSEYYFGQCTSKHKEILFVDKIPYEALEGQLIIRGWLPVSTEPRCVYVRARSPYGALVRYHAFKFNFCLCRLTYIYRNSKHIFIYYEWYIPVEMTKGIKWEIIFYK